ncbi:SusD/RagB family nutrient-binding outer membrane lipoprotein [Lewinella sp. IMCC34191]|uniref:SusD/RagB family nutrient-binding outer membrane lipoprotein n=1 Tax=Lewinella sp. IMCC34191 TaxID=2259172 RepID=UPI000E22DA65|nr:SusD/RagB family nutrient-binding outer membrane lipoprotein [Lewinella sp. IMCC34191]
MARPLSLLFLAVMLFACGDLEEFNENPNAPSIDQASPDLILPKILYEVGDELTSSLAWGTGNTLAQLVASNNFTGTDRYLLGSYGGTWNLLYRNARDAQNVIALGERLNNPNYQAAGLLLRGFCMQFLTEMYGDVPFTEALGGKTEGNFQPAYTPQRDIYVQLLADYERAADLFDPTVGLNGDILHDGDIPRWIEFANALRLRTIMRLEDKWDEVGLSAADLQSFVTEANHMDELEDSALLPYLPVGANRWPQHTGRVGGFDEKRMSVTIEGVLEELNDPRLGILFRPVDNPDSDEYVGVPNGLSEDAASNYNGGALNQSRLGTRFREEPDAVDMVFIHYPEVQFLLAEAAEKGYIEGDAEAFYLEGIRSTMTYYGTEATDEYLSQEGVAYTDDRDENLRLIARQKWLSLFMVGLEAWFDYRRTGLPELTPGPDATLDRIPLRIQYPDEEQVLNTTNYQAAVARQGADMIGMPTWLLGE